VEAKASGDVGAGGLRSGLLFDALKRIKRINRQLDGVRIQSVQLHDKSVAPAAAGSVTMKSSRGPCAEIRYVGGLLWRVSLTRPRRGSKSNFPTLSGACSDEQSPTKTPSVLHHRGICVCFHWALPTTRRERDHHVRIPR